MTNVHSRSLFNRDFTLWWIGSAQSAFGNALAGIALSFLVLQQTGSAGAMGVTLALSVLPSLFAPFAGALVDRWPLKLPLIAGDVLRGALQLTIGLLALSGELPLWAVNAAAFANGLIGVFAMPAANAALPHLVPAPHLARANGLVGGAAQLAGLIGLLGGGLLVSRVGPAQALIVDAATFFVMAALLAFVALPRHGASSPKASVLADVRAGARLMRASPLLTFVPVIGFFLNAGSAPVQMLLPKMMLNLGVGAAGYGTFLAVESAGMLAGSALIAALGARLPLRAATGAGLGLIGVGFLLIGVTGAYPLLLAWGAVLGVGIACTNTPLFTLIQQLVPRDFHGRVFSLLMMAATLGMPVTLFALAPFADSVPRALVFGVAGSVSLLSVLAWALVVRAERRAVESARAAAPGHAA